MTTLKTFTFALVGSIATVVNGHDVVSLNLRGSSDADADLPKFFPPPI